MKIEHKKTLKEKIFDKASVHHLGAHYGYENIMIQILRYVEDGECAIREDQVRLAQELQFKKRRKSSITPVQFAKFDTKPDFWTVRVPANLKEWE